jgi:hypothetical protein
MTFDIHEVADRDHDLLDLLSEFTGRGKDQSLACLEVGVNLLEGGDREGSSFSSARLCLRNHVAPLDDGHNRSWGLSAFIQMVLR